jgi:predicted P-loop ATPase
MLERDAIWSAVVHAYKAGETNRLSVDMEIK